MTSNSHKILIALAVVVVAMIVGARARPQQFGIQNWNQFPDSGGNQWNGQNSQNQFQNPGNQWNRPNPQNPFFPSQPGNVGNDQQIITMTPAPATATTASPAFLACMQRCATTAEYNPVCGSDGVNYHNNGRLRCATQCGKSVSATRMGTCNAL